MKVYMRANEDDLRFKHSTFTGHWLPLERKRACSSVVELFASAAASPSQLFRLGIGNTKLDLTAPHAGKSVSFNAHSPALRRSITQLKHLHQLRE
jgi:hypothetical protein